MTTIITTPQNTTPQNSKGRVLFASLVGTTIEFFDFYIYATAAVLVFPHLFFPGSDPATAVLQSFATFAIAFFARPVGSAVFGHFGDRVGRKATLVAALLTMGISTVVIGLLPVYAQIGVAAPLLLALCRFGQGLGLGGEWSGAVLLATENAPQGKRAWYGMFPQLGAPIGFILASGSFLLLGWVLTEDEFMSWGWRVPFLSSAVLVILGLYIRLKLHETPAFQKVLAKEPQKVPIVAVFKHHFRMLIVGTAAAVCTFVLFYLMTVFALSWATKELGYNREHFLILQLIATLFFALFIPVSALCAEKYGRRKTSIWVCVAVIMFGLVMEPLFSAGNSWMVLFFLCLGLSLMGMTYGPIGTVLSELFPTSVRYTGSALTFNIGGILGASLAPYIATTLAYRYSLSAVGYYLAAASCLSLIAFLLTRETKQDDVNNQI